MKSIIYLPISLTFFIFTLNVNAATIEEIVSDAINNQDKEKINKLLSELSPKAASVCSKQSSKCDTFRKYIDDLTAAVAE